MIYKHLPYFKQKTEESGLTQASSEKEVFSGPEAFENNGLNDYPVTFIRPFRGIIIYFSNAAAL